MGVIRELPTSVVNQIAAGEVIERPASVVKELLENAIDSGARRIELSIERGGRDLIRVADDGCGILPEDLPLAFRPHATSKLKTADDLAEIRTLGFRGEALAAIAQISRVRCQSRAADQEFGSEVLISAGESSEIKTVPAAHGTVIEVQNLFYNVPVRRAFLKSDSTEASHVTETFTRVALAHPQVHFTLVSGRRVIHDLAPSQGMKERIAVFFGQELADSLLWVESRIERIHLKGYVAHPSQSRSTNKCQYLFIGGRFVRDRSLSAALAEAYRGLLMVGRQPIAFLQLELPFEDVDVNVHPTKIEVRFRDSHRIYSQVLSTLRQTFLASDLHARLQPPAADAGAGLAPAPGPAPPGPTAPPQARGEAPEFQLWPGSADRQQVANWFAPAPTGTEAARRPVGGSYQAPQMPEGFGQPAVPEWADRLPPADARRGFDEFDDDAAARDRATDPGVPAQAAGEPANGVVGALAEARPAGSSHSIARVLQVHDSYLIAETDEGMVVIDQHALHERILYEEFRRRIDEGGVESQRLLVPEPVPVAPADRAALLEHAAVLRRLGLEIEPLDEGHVGVAATPVMLAHLPAARLVQDMADHFRTTPLPPTADGLLENVLATMACKAAVKAGQRLSYLEMLALLERRHLAANSHHCPHGRPASLVFTRSELERQFGRI